MSAVIRDATDADAERMAEMGRRFIESSRYRNLIGCDNGTMAETARKLIESPDALVLVAEKDGAIVGTIGMIATFHPCSGEPVMSELFWWVEPEHRGCGLRLLKAAEDWGRSIGVTRSIMVSPSPEISVFYRRVGYELLEEQFIKPL